MNEYVIWSIEHTAWWRPGGMGYTPNLHEAGRYTQTEATNIVEGANIVSVNECWIPVAMLGGVAELRDLLQRTVRYCPVEVQDQAYAAIAKADAR